MYFWEDDEEERRDPFQLTMANLPSGNFARSIAGAPAAAAPPILPPITKSPASLYDGFHDAGGYETMPPQMAPGFGRQPGGGYAGGGEHALDGLFNNGMANPGRVWTEADLEPLTVGSFGGFNFSKAATPYTQANPNLPLFRADMAQRSQGLNFAAELAASKNRMDFQAGENEQDRALRRELAGDSNALKKDQALAFLADPNIPQHIKDIKSREAVESGKITPQQAGNLKLSQLLADAAKAGLRPDSLEFWKYVSGNYDPNSMSNLDLIAQLQKMNVPASTLAQIADPVTNNSNLGGAYHTIRGWMGGGQSPDEVRARNFARSLLSR